ncbi:hypothetical protein EDD68_11219 [Melghiribacillus thermohalophilus]|uniref:Uncharacterized protein n=1 Tax=Melghiribacillus thermohalophilus TaxID=1324956 RepID=A0A4R3MZ01_9BACI|nr:hypothetical protein [Melghiribacillus thermohalophilus]TCT20891.1 hypothetical protein EDD68_11219 [Melghiribacillus thermohalophilus]
MEFYWAGFLFWFLLTVSVITFIAAFWKRLWWLMAVSGLTMTPVAVYFSFYPLYPWAKFVPVIHFVLAIIFFISNRNVGHH